ncbi:MAG: hypothetical protein UV95_C0003G0038 [Candidatus Falkowbacteria bacterium GW2011_GWF2_43_32]|nr:MAG: hypothetical protein UV95_C0003G0038 [Candidatus Falkowbacteria bacterium GW2011_GWF2_43_32]
MNKNHLILAKYAPIKPKNSLYNEFLAIHKYSIKNDAGKNYNHFFCLKNKSMPTQPINIIPIIIQNPQG